MDQIMEVNLSGRHPSPTRCLPSKRDRPLPSPSHSEDPPNFTLEDVKKFKKIAEHHTHFECTTSLPKCNMYPAVLDDAVIKHLAKEKGLIQNVKEPLSFLADDFEISVGVGSDIWPSRTGPVLQVSYVTISNRSHPEGFEIYGEISMADYKRDTFYIFKCEPEEPEYVELDSDFHLYLTACPIVPAMGGKVKFSLTNKDSGVQIFDKECYVKDAMEDDNEGTFTLECNGTGGYQARMVFTKIPFAVIAKVGMFLHYTPPHRGNNKTSFEVEGKITANQAIVMDHPESVQMEYGKRNLIVPYRFVFAASVASSLVVKVKLNTGNLELADKTYTITACSESLALPRTSLFTEDTGCCIEIDVDWIPYDDFFRRSDLQWLSYVSDPAVGTPHGPVSRERFEPVTTDLVEVFSVSISGDLAPGGLSGRITVEDDEGTFFIFARSLYGPDELLSSNKQQFRTVSLAWPARWVLEKNLFMRLKLRDVKTRHGCIGHLSWHAGQDGRYDRRLCDVIESEGWFAAVHYSVFENGKKATVSVWCIDGGPYTLYGSVFAQYDNHDYPSLYDEQCYRSTIFRRSVEECTTVENGSEVQLLKSHVAAPSDCEKLIVVADLWVLHPNMTSFKPVTGELHFEAKRRLSSQSKYLGGCFLVTVNWS